ncbi:YqeG family HAD IIIA-type phosphatase [Ruminococcaceae bacterium OttesenSCG-928-I18]|nr:YqeG family HAD IIIA-type phosphatase [Ruminococcaceae bacterium OttesenSCG-928-I18]
MPFLTPEYYFRSVTRITPQFLRNKGISALVLDVDNTLAEHDSQEVSPEVMKWLAEMRKAGICMMLASNNLYSRVEPFARKLGLQFASFCCKPSPKWLVAAVRHWGLPPSSIALVGDQIFTDVFAGHLVGVKVLLVKPISEDIKPTIRLKRRLEAPFLARYFRKGGKLL